jgi:CRISPR-associated protein Cas1
LITKNTEILQNLPETHVKKMILVGSVNLTTPVVAFCLENRIEVVFLTQGGKFRGRLQGDWSNSVEIRRKQYDRSADRDFCLGVARTIVAGKINNQMAFARRQNDGTAADAGLRTMRSMRDKALKATSIETLLGIEGSASAAYFRLFGGWVPKPFAFTKRSAHPPLDEMNALLSLSYTLLYNRISTHLNTIGLDPFLGFFHQPRNGHAALASDLVEEFRPIIADSLVIKLVRRKQLRPSDFNRIGSKINLTTSGQKTFFSEFEAKISSKRHVASAGGNTLSFSRIIELQAHHLSRVILGRDREYLPFTLK